MVTSALSLLYACSRFSFFYPTFKVRNLILQRNLIPGTCCSSFPHCQGKIHLSQLGSNKRKEKEKPPWRARHGYTLTAVRAFPSLERARCSTLTGGSNVALLSCRNFLEVWTTGAPPVCGAVMIRCQRSWWTLQNNSPCQNSPFWCSHKLGFSTLFHCTTVISELFARRNARALFLIADSPSPQRPWKWKTKFWSSCQKTPFKPSLSRWDKYSSISQWNTNKNTVVIKREENSLFFFFLS